MAILALDADALLTAAVVLGFAWAVGALLTGVLLRLLARLVFRTPVTLRDAVLTMGLALPACLLASWVVEVAGGAALGGGVLASWLVRALSAGVSVGVQGAIIAWRLGVPTTRGMCLSLALLLVTALLAGVAMAVVYAVIVLAGGDVTVEF